MRRVPAKAAVIGWGAALFALPGGAAQAHRHEATLPAAVNAVDSGSGGVRYQPGRRRAPDLRRAPKGTGGVPYDHRLGKRPARKRKRRDRSRPVLASFRVSRRSVFAFGKATRITYRITDRSQYVRVRIDFLRARSTRPLYRLRLGRKRTGITHTLRWRGTDGGRLVRQGAYRIRVSASDPAGNTLLPGSQSRVQKITFRWHRFPVRGPHSLDGPGAGFGAPRKGRSHRGHDIPAPEGTPVVAPRGGTITWRAFQAEGAGYYLVLDARGERYNYVFMHLQRGSTLVRQGERVRTGQLLARVGSTGISSGPHLHFEIWRGRWFDGGEPIDPLPKLRVWDRFS